MAESVFEPGEQVTVKSGGPVMTVKAAKGDTVFCVWMDGNHKKEDGFLAATLKPYDESNYDTSAIDDDGDFMTR